MDINLDSVWPDICDDELGSGFLNKDKKLIIYGAGNFGKVVFQVMMSLGFKVIGFLDRNAKPGEHYQGTPVLVPEAQSFSFEKKQNIQIVLAVHNRDVEPRAIADMLKEIGYTRIISPVSLYDICGRALCNRYWLTSRSYYRQHRDVIKATLSCWADDTSKKLYRDILKYRITGDMDVSIVPDLECQYVPIDIPSWKEPYRFVDCGAYDGDTILRFCEIGIPIESLAAFEPDPDSFHKLSRFILEECESIGDVSLWPCGLYSATTKMTFSSGMGESTRMSASGHDSVQCVSLDEAIPRFRPTLIKMDIEGAEYDALIGARRIIEKYRPGLAICVYHRPDDLWRIPLLIRRWDLGYEFYLRQHAFNGFDVVMYAIQRSE